MPSYYRIKGCPGLESLIVEGYETDISVEHPNDNRVYDLVCAEAIINPGVAVGDSTLKWPQPPLTVFFIKKNLEEIDYSPREFSTENPFGALEYEGHWSRGTIHVDYASYENGMSVNVKDTSVNPVKTVFTENFYGDYQTDAQEAIEQALRHETDVDDLVFELTHLAEMQNPQRMNK